MEPDKSPIKTQRPKKRRKAEIEFDTNLIKTEEFKTSKIPTLQPAFAREEQSMYNDFVDIANMQSQLPTAEQFFSTEEHVSLENYGLEPDEYNLLQASRFFIWYKRLLSTSQTGFAMLLRNGYEFKEEQKIQNPILEIVGRRYCADFLREARQAQEYGERLCMYNNECIFNVLHTVFPAKSGDLGKANAMFICREFLLPSQQSEWYKNKVLPYRPGPCLGCTRYHMTLRVKINEKHNARPVGLIQNHANIVASDPAHCTDDTYMIDKCLMPAHMDKPNGILAPVIAFHATDYVYSKIQVGTGKMRETLRCVFESPTNFRDASAAPVPAQTQSGTFLSIFRL